MHSLPAFRKDRQSVNLVIFRHFARPWTGFSFLPERNNANLPSEQFFSASKRRNPLPICKLLPAGFPRSLIRKSLALRTGSYHSAPVFFPQDNTDRTRCNSFRCFCTVSVCQYVYYWLRRVATRQSSRRLASMQGARIKACGSFPPQIVLALTSSKNSRRGSRAAPLCGDPETKSSENLLLSGAGSSAPGDPGGVRALISFRVGIPHKQFEYALYDLGRVYTDDLHKSSSIHSLI